MFEPDARSRKPVQIWGPVFPVFVCAYSIGAALVIYQQQYVWGALKRCGASSLCLAERRCNGKRGLKKVTATHVVESTSLDDGSSMGGVDARPELAEPVGLRWPGT